MSLFLRKPALYYLDSVDTNELFSSNSVEIY